VLFLFGFLVPLVSVAIVATNAWSVITFMSHKGYKKEIFNDLSIKMLLWYAIKKQLFIEKYKKQKLIEILQKRIFRTFIAICVHVFIGVLYLAFIFNIIYKIITGLPILELAWITPQVTTEQIGLLGTGLVFYLFVLWLVYIKPIFEYLKLFDISYKIDVVFVRTFNIPVYIIGFLVFCLYTILIIFLYDLFINYYSLGVYIKWDVLFFVIALVIYHYLVSKRLINKLLLKFKSQLFNFIEYPDEIVTKLLHNNTYMYMVVFFLICVMLGQESSSVAYALGISFLFFTYIDNNSKIKARLGLK